MKRNVVHLVLAAALTGAALSGCASSGQSQYNSRDVGRATSVEFGTVLASRPIEIKGEGALPGGAIGGLAGGLAMSNVGQGTGNTAAIAGGALAGMFLGAMVGQAVTDRVGVEYTVTMTNGKTVVIAQEQAKEDRVFNPSDPVMIQTGVDYQRVLAADHLPDTIKAPKTVKIQN